jgi:hypothetical protein
MESFENWHQPLFNSFNKEVGLIELLGIAASNGLSRQLAM